MVLFIPRIFPGMLPVRQQFSHLYRSELFRGRRDAVGSITHETAICWKEISMSENTGYTHPELLVDAGWLQAHLADPMVRLIEVDVDTTAYQQGHIPGAVGFNWQKDLQDQVIRAPISKARLETLLSRTGVSNDSTIVLYGDHNNWFAAWAFWILKYYGHRDVRLLNGGRGKWLADKREITTQVPSYAPTSYAAQAPRNTIRAFRDQVLLTLGRRGGVLVDVRSPGEYSGELLAPANWHQERARRGGHWPSPSQSRTRCRRRPTGPARSPVPPARPRAAARRRHRPGTRRRGRSRDGGP